MTDTPIPTPLTDQALARLRKLAMGNGLNPDKIELFGTEEQTYTLKGTLTLLPKCDIQTGRYPGPARGGKSRTILPDLGTMHNEVNRRKQQFETGQGWIETSLKELKAAPGEGWGLEGAHITMPEYSGVLTASTACPQCHGQKLITCPTCHGQGTVICQVCHGQRQEICYACGGTGNNPQNPNQRCTVCNGIRFTPCRRCHGSGQMTCPTCNGRRGTPCPGCNGSGLVSEEIILECIAQTHFKIEGEGLPSGLRKGLSRLGYANLAKGHADIMLLPPVQEEEPEHKRADDEEKKITSHDIKYEAKMPYADLRMNFNGKRAVVGAFGKRGALLDVPNFLDDALSPAREKLALAVTGSAPLNEALDARAIGEALQLELNGKGTINEFRRLYSVGLSQEAMQEILGNLRLVLKKHTLKTRSLVAVLCGIICTGIFAGLFLTDFHASFTQNWPMPMQLAFDLALLVLPIGISWFALNLATRSALQRHFHKHTIALQQTIGKTGYALFAAIAVIYVVILFLTPMKPLWLLALHL